MPRSPGHSPGRGRHVPEALEESLFSSLLPFAATGDPGPPGEKKTNDTPTPALSAPPTAESRPKQEKAGEEQPLTQPLVDVVPAEEAGHDPMIPTPQEASAPTATTPSAAGAAQTFKEESGHDATVSEEDDVAGLLQEERVAGVPEEEHVTPRCPKSPDFDIPLGATYPDLSWYSSTMHDEDQSDVAVLVLRGGNLIQLSDILYLPLPDGSYLRSPQGEGDILKGFTSSPEEISDMA